jgi:predicted nuclease with TOPRIM domain
MTTMTLSPLQQDYVTKAEFNEFRSEVSDRFDRIDAKFDDIDAKFDKIDERFDRIDERFVKIDEKFDKIDERFAKIDEKFVKIDEKFVTWKDEIINTLTDEFSRQTGIIIETFQHNLKASMEYLDAKLDKKLDKAEFYEYLEIHFPKQSKMPAKKATNR